MGREDEGGGGLRVPIDRQTFERNRPFRFGRANPEWIHNAAWEYMIRTRQSSLAARGEHGVDDSFADQRDFCFARFGSSVTPMADGRLIVVGGEHEDFYDPDFIIFNDVIVLRPAAGEKDVTSDGGSIEIYGYPRLAFPPTDFHSATLVGDKIYLIGNGGYSEDRRYGTTPVFALDTGSYRIERVDVAGSAPGWISRHFASLSPDGRAIIVRGGKIDHGPGDESYQNHEACYRLDLDRFCWELVSPRERHRRFWFRCPKPSMVAIDEVLESVLVGAHWLPGRDDELAPKYHLAFEGVRVKFEDGLSGLRMRVEGNLPRDVIDGWVAGMKSRLEEVTSEKCDVQEVADWNEANQVMNAEIKKTLSKYGHAGLDDDLWMDYDEP